jgi:hypothetical protein
MTSDQVRTIAGQVEAFVETLPRSSFKREYFGGIVTDIRRIAGEMDDLIGSAPFTYSMTPIVMLRVSLSAAMKDRFEDWLDSAKVSYSGGSGSGDSMGRSWSMTYYFTRDQIERAAQWLSAAGAQSGGAAP